jgi:hypothetical protein
MFILAIIILAKIQTVDTNGMSQNRLPLNRMGK